ncbi:MAG: diacylglycerol/lipid kinase family protein [Acidimicrobiales bacterium]
MVVVNPRASAVTDLRRRVVIDTLRSHFDVEVLETNSRGHATVLGRSAADARCEAAVVLGGDGTANEVANGLAGSPTAMAALPGGSTNVVARALGFSHRLARATDQMVDALGAGSTRRIGLGRAGDRHFLVNAGMGFDAAVVGEAERQQGLKRRIGQPVFLYAALATWVRYADPARPRMSVTVAGGGRVDDAHLAICCNGHPYTFAGPRALDIAPDADFDRGLAVVALRTMGLVPLLSVVGSALGLGRPVAEHPAVSYHHDVAEVTVEGHGPFPYQLDGELLGETTRLVLTHCPDQLNVAVPAPLDQDRPKEPLESEAPPA